MKKPNRITPSPPERTRAVPPPRSRYSPAGRSPRSTSMRVPVLCNTPGPRPCASQSRTCRDGTSVNVSVKRPVVGFGATWGEFSGSAIRPVPITCKGAEGWLTQPGALGGHHGVVPWQGGVMGSVSPGQRHSVQVPLARRVARPCRRWCPGPRRARPRRRAFQGARDTSPYRPTMIKAPSTRPGPRSRHRTVRPRRCSGLPTIRGADHLPASPRPRPVSGCEEDADTVGHPPMLVQVRPPSGGRSAGCRRWPACRSGRTRCCSRPGWDSSAANPFPVRGLPDDAAFPPPHSPPARWEVQVVDAQVAHGVWRPGGAAVGGAVHASVDVAPAKSRCPHRRSRHRTATSGPGWLWLVAKKSVVLRLAPWPPPIHPSGAIGPQVYAQPGRIAGAHVRPVPATILRASRRSRIRPA